MLNCVWIMIFELLSAVVICARIWVGRRLLMFWP